MFLTGSIHNNQRYAEQKNGIVRHNVVPLRKDSASMKSVLPTSLRAVGWSAP